MNEEGDRSESRDWWRMTVTPEAGEHYEKLEQDSGPCKKGPCVLCWKRMPESAESENKSRRSYW